MKLIKRLMTFFMVALCTLLFLFVGVGYVNYKKAVSDVSIQEKVTQIKNREDYVTIDQISKDLLEATVSIEDRRFYQHNGVDYRSLLRALVDNIFAKGIVGGGSTITQQLGKNLYFDYQPSYIRKMSELFLAYDLESELSKQEILELYVNVINYGDNHMGIAQASKGYFHKSSNQLTLNEASLLAGLPQSPSNYQLSNHLEAAKIRQQQVLKAMLRDGTISEADYQGVVSSKE